MHGQASCSRPPRLSAQRKLPPPASSPTCGGFLRPRYPYQRSRSHRPAVLLCGYPLFACLLSLRRSVGRRPAQGRQDRRHGESSRCQFRHQLAACVFHIRCGHIAFLQRGLFVVLFVVGHWSSQSLNVFVFIGPLHGCANRCSMASGSSRCRPC